VRYSGTQPLCRVMVEGPTREETEAACETIAVAVRREIGL
jgi:phosphoglucosamine mutase